MDRFAVDELGPGEVREVLVAPAPVLSQRCADVSPSDSETVALAADLLATM